MTMLIDDFINRIGGTVKRRHKSDKNWREYEVRDEKWATYYYNLQEHGFDFQF